jgi:hypothetical protein
METKMPEIVYLLTNPVMPDLVKIGRTINLEERVRLLSAHSGVPVPFEVFYACEVSDSAQVERSIQEGFGDHRINPKREFFRINPERILAILKLVELRDVTPADDVVVDNIEQDLLNRERNRRDNFTFSVLGLKAGSVLTFVRDETITATVVDDKRILFEGKETSLSHSALGVLRSRFGYRGRSCAGPRYWCFEGKTLSEMRMDLETSDEG